MVKGSIRKGITLVNIYAPNTGPPKHIEPILTDIRRENYCRERSELSSHEAVFTKVTRRGRKVIVSLSIWVRAPQALGPPCKGALLLTFFWRRGICRELRVPGPGVQPYPSELLP